MSLSAVDCKYVLAPSVLSADFGRLGDELHMLEAAGARYVHIDVMDGVFVPNLTLGMPVVKAIRPHSRLVFDTHLMIVEPTRYIERFAEAGADIITLHIEAVDDPMEAIARIHGLGKRAGLALKPGTGIERVLPFAEAVDMILVMSVEPGFGGQSLIEACLGKAERLRAYLAGRGLSTDIEMDGGVTLANVGRVVGAGVNVVVAGSAVFDAEDRDAAVKAFLGAMGAL